MKNAKLMIGLVFSLIVVWATGAQAIDWFSNPTGVPKAASPRASEPTGMQQALTEQSTTQVTNKLGAEIEAIKEKLGCLATPICGNGYILSKDSCPNQLPGDIPTNAYPVKSCYSCKVPTKVSAISKDQLCLASGYSVLTWYWGKGTYECYLNNCGSSYQPTNFLKLCPDGMGAENFWKNGENCSYQCRFAMGNVSICGQCGAIEILGGQDGEVYCVLPANLPPPDPNKPCGK